MHLRNRVRVETEGGVIRVYRVTDAGVRTPRCFEVGKQVSSVAEAIERLTRDWDWEKVDWTLPNMTLAAQAGVTRDTVRRMRRKHAPDTEGMLRSGPAHRLKASQFPGVDWTLHAWELHLRLGVTYFVAKRLKAEGLGTDEAA